MSDGGDLSREERLELEDDGYIVEHPDHDDLQRIPVPDWEHVKMRITGTPDHIPESDGVDMELDVVAGDGAVAELIVKGEVVARLVHTDL